MPKKPKRYEKRDLINKIRSHLRSRYKVPEELIDHINFDEVIQEGMTMSEAYEALVRNYPDLRKYLERRKDIRKIEEEIEEDLYKQAKLIRDMVDLAKRGDELAKELLRDLLERAIVKEDKDAIELIRLAYDTSPGEFARSVLIPAGVISEQDLNFLIEKAKVVRPPPPPPPEEVEEFERVVKDVEREIEGLKGALRKLTLEDLRKMGVSGLKAIVDRYASELNLKKEKLKRLKEKLPGKSKEIDAVIKKIDREISEAKKFVEGLTAYDVESAILKAVERLGEVIARVIKEEMKGLAREIRKLSGELTPEEWKWACVCYYCGQELAYKFYENKAVGKICAVKLEKQWRERGLKPEEMWNPDDYGECTVCGQLVKVFRCSGGLIYCLEHAAELGMKLVFDDELEPIKTKAKSSVKRILEKYGLK